MPPKPTACAMMPSDWVHGTVEGAPVCGHAIAVLAVRTAAHVFAGIVNNAAVAAGDLERNAQYLPDALQLVHQLCVDHLGGALTALALELVSGEVFAQCSGVTALIGYDAHKISTFHRKS